MIYSKEQIYECIFIKRINRFVATVILDGKEIDVHVKNTGRCRELLITGVRGYLLKSDNLSRKYAYDLIAVYKGDLLVNIDSQVPNTVVYNFLKSGQLFSNITNIKREVTFKNSRFDIYFERQLDDGSIEKAFMEVKGVTLFEGDRALFPDAPTTRGAKHLHELILAKEEGYEAYVFFLIQGEGLKTFESNKERDKNFSDALEKAYKMGVEVLCYNSNVLPDNIIVKDKMKFLV